MNNYQRAKQAWRNLAAKLRNPQPVDVWQPVEDVWQYTVEQTITGAFTRFEIDGKDYALIVDSEDGLPPNIRLCRKVEREP